MFINIHTLMPIGVQHFVVSMLTCGLIFILDYYLMCIAADLYDFEDDKVVHFLELFSLFLSVSHFKLILLSSKYYLLC